MPTIGGCTDITSKGEEFSATKATPFPCTFVNKQQHSADYFLLEEREVQPMKSLCCTEPPLAQQFTPSTLVKCVMYVFHCVKAQGTNWKSYATWGTIQIATWRTPHVD